MMATVCVVDHTTAGVDILQANRKCAHYMGWDKEALCGRPLEVRGKYDLCLSLILGELTICRALTTQRALEYLVGTCLITSGCQELADTASTRASMLQWPGM